MGTAQPGRRICVVGSSGCGKTYVAEALSKALSIPYVCNDAIIWQPDWQPTPETERDARTEAATRVDAWTFDGNVSVAQARIVLDRCDTLVWLDLPRWQVHVQVLWRTVTHLISKTPHWRDGNVERWRMFFSRESIVWWSIRMFASRRRRYRAMFADPAYAGVIRIRLASRRDVNRWLKSVALVTKV
jgi:adenylate kinase family enzyme